MIWGTLAAGLAVAAAALLVRRYYGDTAKHVGAWLRARLGERGVRALLAAIYGGTLLLWFGIYFWAKSEGVQTENPFDRALGDLFKR